MAIHLKKAKDVTKFIIRKISLSYIHLWAHQKVWTILNMGLDIKT